MTQESLLNVLELTVGAMLVYNFVLSRFLGICPFLGVSRRLDTALGMSAAVVFVMTISSAITATIYNLGLKKTFLINGTEVNLLFLKVLIFIAVIAALVQIVEVLLQKFSPPLYKALGIYLPLITTNCAVLGAAMLNSVNDRGIWESTVFSFFSALGFGLALVLFSSLRERLDLSAVPRPFQGMAIALITAGILAMAFVGFSGLC
ncbi:MAG: RnfABCDGE type electron transport complex subunit A [Victivallaceae bacterium]|jgi:electron transport complex protein RnfA|nr:RnfABCDGE type electron transport complex subunit A [Victivallaceae bacterium]NLK83605.1 RnfABCDGE type electron transport complex subunit A [Lentisphaerota bacterium]MDD3116318.1 RnfABCDGE type electron transport complex subunit A [Victivallaceae bacterium]MDD3702760.1 RnfABCDGE type electron transport complex subunit A [Victivallaceae bacterium]MDD4317480.1 RnfABCDGE type electron transport complex subunit A [Victivallaceae bacterium]